MSEYQRIGITDFNKNNQVKNSETKTWTRMENVFNIKLLKPCNYLNYNPKKKCYFYGQDMSICMIFSGSNKLQNAFTKEKNIINCFSLRKDGCLGVYGTEEGETKILSLTHKSILKSFKISNSNIDCVDIVDKKFRRFNCSSRLYK